MSMTLKSDEELKKMTPKEREKYEKSFQRCIELQKQGKAYF